MFELAWKVMEPYGDQSIKLKAFRTSERRQDFIDTMYQDTPGFQVVSMNSADSHTVYDFERGTRVKILKAKYLDRIGKTGTVARVMKGSRQVYIYLDDGNNYLSYAWNLQIL